MAGTGRWARNGRCDSDDGLRRAARPTTGRCGLPHAMSPKRHRGASGAPRSPRAGREGARAESAPARTPSARRKQHRPAPPSQSDRKCAAAGHRRRGVRRGGKGVKIAVDPRKPWVPAVPGGRRGCSGTFSSGGSPRSLWAGRRGAHGEPLGEGPHLSGPTGGGSEGPSLVARFRMSHVDRWRHPAHRCCRRPRGSHHSSASQAVHALLAVCASSLCNYIAARTSADAARSRCWRCWRDSTSPWPSAGAVPRAAR